MVQIAPDSPKLAGVMVGPPARGKSYTARRIERYLSWLGYRTRIFKVGEYRRARVGTRVPHSFFGPDNRRVKRHGRLRSTTPATPRARRAMAHACCERASFQVLFIGWVVLGLECTRKPVLVIAHNVRCCTALYLAPR
jgi:hypothetical protein